MAHSDYFPCAREPTQYEQHRPTKLKPYYGVLPLMAPARVLCTGAIFLRRIPKAFPQWQGHANLNAWSASFSCATDGLFLVFGRGIWPFFFKTYSFAGETTFDPDSLFRLTSSHRSILS